MENLLIDIQSKRYYHSPENHEWAVTWISIYLQLKFNEIENYYLTPTLVFLTGVELKKKYAFAWKGELSNLFYGSDLCNFSGFINLN